MNMKYYNNLYEEQIPNLRLYYEVVSRTNMWMHLCIERHKQELPHILLILWMATLPTDPHIVHLELGMHLSSLWSCMWLWRMGFLLDPLSLSQSHLLQEPLNLSKHFRSLSPLHPHPLSLLWTSHKIYFRPHSMYMMLLFLRNWEPMNQKMVLKSRYQIQQLFILYKTTHKIHTYIHTKQHNKSSIIRYNH